LLIAKKVHRHRWRPLVLETCGLFCDNLFSVIHMQAWESLWCEICASGLHG
jgi:hypothetical protein